jgi:hypothetical protein
MAAWSAGGPAGDACAAFSTPHRRPRRSRIWLRHSGGVWPKRATSFTAATFRMFASMSSVGALVAVILFYLFARAVGPTPVTHFPISAPGACFVGPHSPRSPPLAPPAPPRTFPHCSSASQLLWRSVTSHVRAHRLRFLSFPTRTSAASRLWSATGSPGSRTRSVCTCQGLRPRRASRALACRTRACCLPRRQRRRHLGKSSFAAQWLACAIPCRRFASDLTVADARLGANADRYSFIVVDLHHLLRAGLPALWR